MGTDSSLKLPQYRGVITFDNSENIDFYVDYMLDNNPDTLKTHRVIKQFGGNMARWTDDDDDLSQGHFTDDDDDTSGGIWFDGTDWRTTFIIERPAKFRQLKIRFYTKGSDQHFAIKRFELKNIKISNSFI